jgi:hypothetical protein
MTVQNTSLIAFEGAQKHITRRQKICLNAIFWLKRASNYDISAYTGMPINCVCPRVKELRDMGEVIEDKVAKGHYNRDVTYWKARQKNLFD